MFSNYAICRVTIAFVWLYHGVVPKLLGPHEDELAMNMALGLSELAASRVSMMAGWLEVAMAVVVVGFWRQRWPLLLTAVAMPGLTLFVAIWQPSLLLGAFNPITTNISVLVLSLVALRSDLPTHKSQSGDFRK